MQQQQQQLAPPHAGDCHIRTSARAGGGCQAKGALACGVVWSVHTARGDFLLISWPHAPRTKETLCLCPLPVVR